MLHWNYLLAIENDLENLSRYIEFDAKNFACFSIEIARILLTSGAEVDVVCKQLCKKLNASSKADSIHQYRDEIIQAFPQISDFNICMDRYGIILKPWEKWQNTKDDPLWWTAYNKIKHERMSEYARANLENVLNAISGLFVVTLYFYKDEASSIGGLSPIPKMLQVEEKYFGGMCPGSQTLSIRYLNL
jgi:hypothetical protein